MQSNSNLFKSYLLFILFNKIHSFAFFKNKLEPLPLLDMQYIYQKLHEGTQIIKIKLY